MRRMLWCSVVLLLALQLAACGISAGPINITVSNQAPQSGSATAAPTTSNGKHGNTSPTTAPPTTNQASRLAQQLLNQINQDRAANDRSAYVMEQGLVRSAYQHNLVMAGGCGLNHICPNEPQLGTRENNQGVQWNYAGENIGMGGPVQSSYDSQWSMTLRLHRGMMGEQPPDDGHRQNLLSSNFHRIGISIYVDTKDTLWLTEDFAN